MNLSMYYNVGRGVGFIRCDCLQMFCVVCYVYQTLLRACNVTYAHLCMDICRKLATDSMNVVLCIGLLYSLLSTRPFNW